MGMTTIPDLKKKVFAQGRLKQWTLAGVLLLIVLGFAGYMGVFSSTKDEAVLLRELEEACASDKSPEKARAFLERAVRNHPELARAHECLGMILHRMEDYRGAAGEYRKALDLGSTDVSTRLNLGWALLEDNQAKAALKMFKDLERVDGKSSASATGRAAALTQLGEHYAARAIFERVITRDPEYAPARYHYARLLIKPRVMGTMQGCIISSEMLWDPMGAAYVLVPVVNKPQPGNIPAVLLMASALEGIGRYKDGRDLLEEALKEVPGDARLQRALRAGPNPGPFLKTVTSDYSLFYASERGSIQLDEESL
jgi:tetratricopeptide (TPR) repeat protein